jgi:hypothetical protein
MTIDPNEYTIPELGPKLKDIEDVSELDEILQKEHRGENRSGAIALIESRIEKFSEDDDEDDDGEVELAGMSVADVGNAVRGIEEVGELEALIEQEEAGEDRDSVKRLIRQRIDSVRGGDPDPRGATPGPRSPDRGQTARPGARGRRLRGHVGLL